MQTLVGELMDCIEVFCKFSMAMPIYNLITFVMSDVLPAEQTEQDLGSVYSSFLELYQ